MRRLIFIMILQLIQVSYCASCHATNLEIKNKNCEYSVQCPTGFDTIPIDTLSNRFGLGLIDAGFFNTKNESYYDGEYIQYIFLPTVKSLNQFSFKQLAADFSKSIKTGENQKQTDTLSLFTTNFKIDIIQQCFYISGKIKKNIKEIFFSQVVIPTKFGFLKVIRYSKNQEDGLGEDTFTKDVISNTQIAANFKYAEPAQKTNLSIWKIVIAFSMALSVYFIILNYPKIRKKYATK